MKDESILIAQANFIKALLTKKVFLSDAARKGYITLADQVLVSFTHFAISLFLARYLVPAEYGVWVLAYSVLLIFHSIQLALIINPMIVIGAPLKKEKAKSYFTSTGIMQTGFGVATSLVLLVTSCIIYLLYNQSGAGYTFMVMAIASFSYLGQEYFRRALFARLRVIDAFMNDLVCYVLQLLGIIFLLVFGILTSANAFWLIGGSALVAIIFGIHQCRDLLARRPSSFQYTLRRNWNYGKWLLGSTMTTWTSGQAYIFIAAFMLGPIAPAVLLACQNILGPTHIMLRGMENIVPSIASNKFSNQGMSTLNKFLKKLTIFISIVMIIYCLLASLNANFLLKILYKGQYTEYSYIVILIAFMYLIGAIGRIPGIGLRVIRKTKGIFYAYLVSTVITIIASIPLIKYFNIIGAAIGLLISAVTVNGIIFYYYLKNIKDIEEYKQSAI